MRTKRLTIGRPPLAPDIEAMVGWLNDPEVVKYSDQRHHPHTLISQEKYLASFGEDRDFLLICEDRLAIGSITIHADWPNATANIGIMIGDKSKWGKGYGFEAWECVCNTLLNTSFRKIEAGCMSLNEPMKKICLKYGMTLEATIPQHFIFKDEMTADALLYGKFAR